MACGTMTLSRLSAAFVTRLICSSPPFGFDDETREEPRVTRRRTARGGQCVRSVPGEGSRDGMRTHELFTRGQIDMPTALCHQADSVMSHMLVRRAEDRLCAGYSSIARTTTGRSCP